MAAEASCPRSFVGFSRRARAVRRTWSQSRRSVVPPRGRTASATAAVARPSRMPYTAVRPTERLIPTKDYERQGLKLAADGPGGVRELLRDQRDGELGADRPAIRLDLDCPRAGI